MTTAATGTDVSVPYTTEALVARWLPNNYKTAQGVGAGPSNVQGQVSVDDIADLINERSRTIDGRLRKVFRTPFPAATATNPRIPMQIRLATSYLVAADIRAILKFGSRGTENSKELEDRAELILVELELNPHSVGLVVVSAVDRD